MREIKERKTPKKGCNQENGRMDKIKSKIKQVKLFDKENHSAIKAKRASIKDKKS